MQGKILVSMLGILASSVFLVLLAAESVCRENMVTALPLVVVEDIPLEDREELTKIDSRKAEIVNAEPAKDSGTVQEMQMYPAFTYDREWSEQEEYLLAQIAEAEAGSESVQGKALVILVVLNRVQNNEFPNSIRSVIYQDMQFSPVSNGTFENTEPDADCWEALEVVKNSQYDFSGGALYFENCTSEDNWHSRNLKFLYQCGRHKFYSKGA